MKSAALLILFVSVIINSYTQSFRLSKEAFSDSVQLEKEMPGLAQQVTEKYKDSVGRSFHRSLFMLHGVAGNYSESIRHIDTLRQLMKGVDTPYTNLLFKQFELYNDAKLQQAKTAQPFNAAFTNLFHDLYTRLNDKEAAHLYYAYLSRTGAPSLYSDLKNSLSRLKGKESLTLDEAKSLCSDYYIWTVYNSIEPIARKLLKEDDDNRYILEDSVMIKTKGGATISAIVIRKRNISQPQPVVLQFTIYTGAAIAVAKDAALNGYVGVLAFSRGKRYSPDEITPYVYDGRDCNDVIDWISKQTWCNGKIGMYGGSYNGFTQWAATKYLHPALKTIVPSASVAPGLDVPMMNNVFESFVFPWTYYVSNNKYLDFADYNDNAKWESIYRNWYASGKPYNKLDSFTGRGKNRIFQQWIAHPAYDSFWQAMIPYREEFSRITIPVLTTTGYYDGGQVGAMYYFREHNKYNKDAVHYVVIGPYSHYGAQGFLSALPDSFMMGYKVDQVAIIPIHDLIFQWFDYILKGGAKPVILQDKINYQPMGTNEWKHAPALDKMSNAKINFYLAKTQTGDFTLVKARPSKTGFISQKVDFSDRKTINNYDHTDKIIFDSLDASNGLIFISEPFKEATEFSGCFTGKLHFAVNKKDFDYSVNIFELMPNGKYFYLTYFMGRASYTSDNINRQLLVPWKSVTRSFTNSYMTSRKISEGSRIVIVLNINKGPYEQINYGTGKNVSTESIEDAAEPLNINWFNDSYITIPIWK